MLMSSQENVRAIRFKRFQSKRFVISNLPNKNFEILQQILSKSIF